MRKSLFFLVTGAMAFTACTSTDIVDESIQSNAIGFSNVVNKPSREITTQDFSKFFVYGYYTKGSDNTSIVSVFSDEPVTRPEGETAWGYTNTRYWVPDATYYFYAYSCDNQNDEAGSSVLNLNGGSLNDRALRINNYVCDQSHQHDLVYAEKEGMVGKQTQNDKVPFEFSHILSKVRITFKSDFAAGYQLKFSNVRITDIKNQGNYNPKGTKATDQVVPGAWSGQTVTGTGNLINFAAYKNTEGKTLDIATAAIPASEGTAAVAAVNARTVSGYVIPGNYGEDGFKSDVKLIFDVQVMDKDGNVVYGQTITGTWQPNWIAGKSYNYNITVNGQSAGLEEIVFDATQNIAGWPGSSSVTPDDETADINIDMSFQSTAITPAN